MCKLKCSCWVMKKHVSIKKEIFFMRFGWKCKCNPELVSWSDGKFDEWNLFKFERNVLWLKIKSCGVSEKLSHRIWKSFLTWKFCLGMKNLPNLMLDHLFLTQMSCALTPKLLSHFPKEKWQKWGSKGWNMGFIYM